MRTPLSALIVEDSASDAALVVRQLHKDGFEVVHQRVESAAQMRAALAERAWDVVLSDFHVPGFGALPALALLRELKLDIPFIVVSGIIGEEAAVALMKAGAHDCVMKDHLALLAPAVKRAVSEAQGRLALRRAEEALRESDTIFSHFMEHSPIFVFFKDENIRALKLSKNFETMLGKPLAELLGKNMDELFPSDLAKSMVAIDRKVLQEGKLVTVEEEFNGRQYSTTKFPIVIDGKPRYLAGYTIDVTEQTQQQQTLQESETQLNSILESTSEGMLAVDLKGKVIRANRRFAEMWRIPQALLEKKDDEALLDFVLGQLVDASAFMNKVHALYTSGAEDMDTLAFKDGRIFERSSSPMKLDGSILGRVWAFRDITGRMQQARALAESEKRFRGLIEQSLTGIYISQNGVLQYANPRLEQLLGYGPGELAGVPFDAIILEEDLPVMQAEREKLRAGAVSATYEVRARRRDGSVIELGMQGHIYEMDGAPATIGMAQDITEKKRADEDIKRYVAQIKAAMMSTVEVATSLSELRDPYTAGHERRVAEIAVALGVELGFDERRLEGLRVAGHLHDVGKMTIPAEILAKPSKLSPIEFKLIQAHPEAGYEVLKKVEFPWPVAAVALQHHERMDGSGYPQGLKGEAILLEARVIAVADVIEAMSSHRPYRPGLGVTAALAEVERGRGTLYDSEVADACLKLFREKGYTVPA